MIIVLMEAASVQLQLDVRHLQEDFGQEELSPSVVDWDAVDDERYGLFP